jgi:hypothetical protein
MVEPQCHLDRPNYGDPLFPDHLHGLEAFMGKHRPMVTHSNVNASDRLPELVENLMRRKQPFRLAPWSPEMPYDRIWVGMTPENPHYEPSVDGGLCIEVIPFQALRMPEEASQIPAPQPSPADLSPGEMVRLVARGWIVRDLDDTLRRLSDNLFFEPRGPVETLSASGYRRARMHYSLPNSATLDVIEPTRWDSGAGKMLHSWGPGPYYARIAVNGLDAKAEDLRARGTKFTVEQGCEEAGGGDMIRVDPEEVGGAIFEFVEFAA